MVDNMQSKPWWESDLDWSLPESLQDKLQAGQRILKNLPATISKYRLNKRSPIDDLTSDPVEKILPQAKAAGQEQPVSGTNPSKPVARPLPKVVAPPPKPASPPHRRVEAKPCQQVVSPSMSAPAQPPGKVSPPDKQNPEVSKGTRFDITADALEKSVVGLSAMPQNVTVSTAQLTTAEAKISTSPLAVRAEVMEVVERRKLTLEQLLDPDFCEYVG